MSSRSTQIDLYSSIDKTDDDYKFGIAVNNVEVSFEAQHADQSAKFYFKDYQFADSGGTLWDMESRFADIETSVSTNNASLTTDVAQLQQDLAAETNARTAGDTANGNAVTAETNARVAAVQAVQSALDVQEAKQEAEKVAADAARGQEVADRQAAVANEAALRAADILTLSNQISSILSNTDAAALDSLTEIVTAYQQGDTTLAAQAASMIQRLDSIEAVLNALVAANL